MKNASVLKAEREQIATDLEALRAPYVGKAGEIPGDVEEKIEKSFNDFLAKGEEVEKAETREKGEAALKAWQREEKGGIDQRPNERPSRDADAETKAFGQLLRNGHLHMGADDLKVVKAYQADDMAGGGFFVMPEQMSDTVLTLMKDNVFVRQHAEVIALTQADSLGVPSIDVDLGDDDWTVELGTGNEETTLKAGKRVLKPHPVARRIKLSKTLARKAPKFEDIVMDRLAYKMGVTEEKAFLTGDGVEKPLGVFTPSTNGISTARDTTASNNNKIVPDDLWATFFSLKAQYRTDARWILGRAVLQAIRTLKDANGNYVWSTGIAPGLGMAGVSPTLLGLPYDESEYCPATPTTTGTYQLALCNWRFYWVVDALDMQVQVLTELYAEKNQNGYILRKETDGAPVQEEAFARLKLA